MRLLLVGTPHERERFKAEMDLASFAIAGEFATLADARASGVEADGLLILSPVGRPFTGRRMAIPEGSPHNDEDDAYEEPLTPREIDVVELLAEGLSNKAIAVRLGISDQTVKFHVAAIYGKLGAANRTDAVRRAVRRGLISL